MVLFCYCVIRDLVILFIQSLDRLVFVLRYGVVQVQFCCARIVVWCFFFVVAYFTVCSWRISYAHTFFCARFVPSGLSMTRRLLFVRAIVKKSVRL